jgi:ribosomal-protein-alanine N-acetyltransferase
MSTEKAALHPVIRSLHPADLDRVMEIEESAYPFPWTRGIFADCLRVGYDCRGLQLGSCLVGYAVQTRFATECHLLNLCIDPSWQRRGYGSLLLEQCIHHAASKNCSSMFLEVRPSNRAGIALYRKRGFYIVGERPDYYRAKHGRESAYIMRLDLDEWPAPEMRAGIRHDPL